MGLSAKSFDLLSFCVDDAVLKNKDGKYTVYVVYDLNSKKFYNFYKKDFEDIFNNNKLYDINKVIVKVRLEGEDVDDVMVEKKEELRVEDVFNEGKKVVVDGKKVFFEERKLDINVEEFRNLITRIKNQNMTIKELREKLLKVKDVNFLMEDIVDLI